MLKFEVLATAGQARRGRLRHKPRYLMGVGTPENLVEGVNVKDTARQA